MVTVLLFAQNTQVLRQQSTPLAKKIQLTDLQDWEPVLITVKEQPKPAGDYGSRKEYLRQWQRLGTATPANGSSRSQAPTPVMLNNFTANSGAQGVPNDNHVAVSDSGIVVSVVNTQIRIYNDTGTQLQYKTLSAFANSLGFLSVTSDPRVLYDPVAKRFIIVFFSGINSVTTKIVVAFSETSDPTKQWNVYALSGNPLNDTTWSDYPIVTLSDKDLFMTFNHLKDGEGWKTGFRYSAIWQIDKQRGYDGDTLQYNYFHHIASQGLPVWSVCPVQGGSQPSGPETYFLSVRPGDLQNDTVFLHKISDSYQSGNAQFSSRILKTPVAYGFPPDARQKDGQYLATNDARVLCAMIENNKIQYVQNTTSSSTLSSGVYIGEIDDPSGSNPTVTAQIIADNTVDYGYPSVAYIGNNSFDHRAIITCSHSPADTFPGTVAFYKDATGNISAPLIIKQGDRAVDVLQDTVERWGDYTGIQRKYNEPNTVWLSGSFGASTQVWRSWVAKVVNTDSNIVSGLKEAAAITAKVFPNPTTERFSVEIHLPTDNYTRFALYDANGREVKVLLEDNCKAGVSIFSFSTAHLQAGTYFLHISNKGQLLRTEKVVITR